MANNINPATAADDLGIQRSANVRSVGDSVEDVMVKYSLLFISLAKKRITEKGKVDTGNMSDIQFSEVKFKDGTWDVTIGYDPSNPASKYYDYQNKGVKGIKSNSPNSVYSFRTLNVSPKMVKAIMEWYMRHRNYIRNETQKKGLTKLQSKRKSIAAQVSPQKKLLEVAENTAKRIKERGLKRIGFFEDNLNVFGPEFKKEVGQAIGKNITINIKQIFEKGTNGNNN
jgi:hypothetical protein